MKKAMSAVILAGGASSRMGQNKALMDLGGQKMIGWVVEPLKKLFQEVIIITNEAHEYEFIEGVKLIPDLIQAGGKNSLVGIYSGLMASSFSDIFIVACDMPFLNTSLIEYMVEHKNKEDVLIPCTDPHYEPLHAIYNVSCIPVIRKSIENHDYKITNILKQLEVKLIEKDEILRYDSLMKCFINVNTQEEYLEISKKLKK